MVVLPAFNPNILRQRQRGSERGRGEREGGGGRQGEGERGRGTERQKQWVCEFKAGMVYIPFSF